MKITKERIRDLVIETLAEQLSESFEGVPSHSADTDMLVSNLAKAIRGSVYDALEESGADDNSLDLLTNIGEMSPEAEAINAAILSAVRQGAVDYKEKIHHPLGGVKPAVAENRDK